MNHPAIPSPPATHQVSGLIRFHGLLLWVLEHDGADYVQAKPLADLAGIDWRRAKSTLQDADNAVLSAVKWLQPPVFASEAGLKTPAPKPVLCLRLDRARMYLARIQTSRMRANGNITGADLLLALQEEWAQALHDYETHGVAIKRGRADLRRQEEASLIALSKAMHAATDAGMKAAFTAMVRDKLAALGYPVAAAPQGRLALDEKP